MHKFLGRRPSPSNIDTSKKFAAARSVKILLRTLSYTDYNVQTYSNELERASRDDAQSIEQAVEQTVTIPA